MAWFARSAVYDDLRQSAQQLSSVQCFLLALAVSLGMRGVAMSESTMSLENLGMAYRKAKVDLFYTDGVVREKLLNYEQRLEENLKQLLEKLNSDDESWIEEASVLGTWSAAPKSFDPKTKADLSSEQTIFSSPKKAWENQVRRAKSGQERSRPCATFRVIYDCAIDFVVLSTLWIVEVGQYLDAQLSDAAYGNRLRRKRSQLNSTNEELNLYSLGCFKPYFKPYTSWRDDGLEAMRTALKEKKDIVTITTDIQCFYHSVDPKFLLSPEFINIFFSDGFEAFNQKQKKIHRLFVRGLQVWAKRTPLQNGLPVGLPASALVANLALIEFDRIFERKIIPLYYGRYVDDIIIVLENKPKFQHSDEVLKWLCDRSDGFLSENRPESLAKNGERFVPQDDDQKPEIYFDRKYLENTVIKLAPEKTKVFLLSGTSGKAFLRTIKREIGKRASEWRALPVLPENADEASANLFIATQEAGEVADNLRKADSLILRRARFAIQLRDYETFQRELHPDDWKKQRLAFFETILEHVLVLPSYFDFAKYLPRIIQLATICGDDEVLVRIFVALNELVSELENNCVVEFTNDSSGQESRENKDNSEDVVDTTTIQEEVLIRWKLRLVQSVRESVVSALEISDENRLELWMDWLRECTTASGLNIGQTSFASLLPLHNVDLFKNLRNAYYRHDLAYIPFRYTFFPAAFVKRHMNLSRAVETVAAKSYDALLEEKILKGVSALQHRLRESFGGEIAGNVLPGLAFATRPFSLMELYLLHQDYLQDENDSNELKKIVWAIRGFGLNERRPRIVALSGKPKNDELQSRTSCLDISKAQESSEIAIGVVNWQTNISHWKAAVTDAHISNAHRHRKMRRLINEIIQRPRQSQYLLFPEVSIPACWFIGLAKKLQRRGISLIGGVEYVRKIEVSEYSDSAKTGPVVVHNQVWAALTHDGLGFPDIILYRQDKQRPAQEEERQLQRLANARLEPEMTTRTGAPLIIEHGAFRFAMLICSELTNIQYRAALRGQIDALFVLEWNQDVTTFNSLVESAALDIHTYVIQCNDRRYGDTRIRGPYKDTWRRDILRIKGGVNDSCLIGTINVKALREFQSGHRSPESPYKPTPDGFEIANARRMLPQ